MKVSELRIGNYHEYLVEDRVDERQQYWTVGKIDWQDLKFLSEREEIHAEFTPDTEPKEHYRAIHITEEWLLKFGFKKHIDDIYILWSAEYGLFQISKRLPIGSYAVWVTGTLGCFKYVHQLQNVFHALTNCELQLNETRGI